MWMYRELAEQKDLDELPDIEEVGNTVFELPEIREINASLKKLAIFFIRYYYFGV